MATASEHYAAFRQIDELLRRTAAASARALAAHRGGLAAANAWCMKHANVGAEE